MWRGLIVLWVMAACGRLDFDAVDDVAPLACEATPEPNDTIATATPIALGSSTSGILCKDDVDVYAVPIAAGDEVEVTLAGSGTGWPTIELVDDAGDTRAIRTLEHTNSGFASHDGTMYVRIAGRTAVDGVKYTLDVKKRAGRYRFIAPAGDDAAPGDFATPWRNFDVAITRLQPGDVLVVLDGVYTVAQNGRFDAVCNSSAASGTAAAPIRVVALTDRRAKLESDGLAPVVHLENGCAYWTLEGLFLENIDASGTTASEAGESVEIYSADHVTVRRVLARHNNRYTNSHVISVDYSTNVLIEDVEVYDYHRGGVVVFESSNVTVRRAFTASRGMADIAGGYNSVYSSEGDEGVALANTSGSLMENSLSVGNGDMAINSGYGSDAVDTRALGSIAIDHEYGFLVSMQDTGAGNTLRTRLESCFVMNTTWYGYYIRSNMDFACTGCTSIGAVVGWQADQLSVQPRVSSAHCTNCLSTGSSMEGFRVTNQTGGWSLESSNSFANGAAYLPASGPELMNAMQTDPQLGGCLVYPPQSSPMRGAGAGGGTVGAEIVYRYENGVLTDIPLWDPQTGAFPCGAVVAGVNDDPSTSCIGIHQRLHVGTPDCPLPYPAL